MAHSGMPQGWDERHQGRLGLDLPLGVSFWVTPGHGFLRVDTRLHTARVSVYDYLDGPNHVLLEEDCSLTVWLAEHGVIPLEPWIVEMAQNIKYS